jgi:hypothetical protein
LISITLLSAGVSACGSADAGDRSTNATSATSPSSATVSVTRTVPPPTPQGIYLNDGDKDHIGDPDRDNSDDNDKDAGEDYKRDDNNSYHDSDDTYAVSQFGNVSSPTVRREVTTLVDRYYHAIARNDSATACSLVLPILATATPLDAGKLGPSYLHGAKTCTQIMSLLSKHFRAQLHPLPVVTGVRNQGANATAELGSRKMPAGWITAQLEHGKWRIAQLFGGALE